MELAFARLAPDFFFSRYFWVCRKTQVGFPAALIRPRHRMAEETLPSVVGQSV